MIRVNLLPFREERQKRQVRNQILGFLGVLLCASLLLCGVVYYMNKTVTLLDRDAQKLTDQIALYREAADKLARIKERLSLLEQKIAVIDRLGQRRYQQAALLAEVAHKIVTGRMWLEQITTDPSMVMIQGMALDHNAVTDFIHRLETSSHYKQIDFREAVSRKSYQGQILLSFILECRKSSHERFESGHGK